MHVLIRGRGRCPDGKCPYDGRCHLAVMDLKGLMHINEQSHVALRHHSCLDAETALLLSWKKHY